MFVYLDETAVFFEAKQKRIIYFKIENTISIKCSGSNSLRMTACVAVTSNGNKLTYILTFKGQPNGRIETSRKDILPCNNFGCCQSNGWMDKRSMQLW